MAISERSRRDTMERITANEIFNELERSDRRDDQEAEEKALEQFQENYSSQAKFSNSKEQKYFLNILRFLMKKKLLGSSKKLVSLSIFYSLRILLRDPDYLLVFVQENGLSGLKKQMDIYIHKLSPDLSDSNNESSFIAIKALGHMLNILQKILKSTPNHAEREFLISSNIIESITHLLNNNRDAPLLHDTLRLLLHMIDKTEFYITEFLKSETIENLLHLLEYKDLETTQLSLHLMQTFLAHPEARQYIPHIPTDFLETFTSYLCHNNVKVLEHAIWCLRSCADNEDGRRKIRLTGAIPLLLSLLENGNRFDYSCPSTNANQRRYGSISKRTVREDSEAVSQFDQLFDMQSACCTCLAELSYDYTNGQTIIERNGIYILAMLLFPENEDVLRLERFNHLQRAVFKTLRFLFSLNKKHDQYQYKRLFPVQIFELFVGIGNFRSDPNLYREITNTWNSIHIDELTKIKNERLQSINPKQEPTRFIRDYGVYECLGSGAFGSVYRVAQRGSTTMYALKEIDNRSLGIDADRSLGKMINEVNIIREELRHPNIVSYYQIFAENDKLYIKMELIAGSSLQDHLSLIKDTNQKMSEDNIWRVLIQLILALRYLHKEKGIVHRDLTANNIMLDDEYRVKISKYCILILHNKDLIETDNVDADFGLAKLRNSDCSKMTSVVGTMYYACPEIIQHLKYNEKADIWSLGCVLYHMAALVPPFFTSNILLLASKICASEYDQAPLQHYSNRIRQIVIECLTVDPLNRPNICGIAQLCTEQLMLYTDRSCTTIQSLEKRLRQRDRQREHYSLKQQSQLQQQSNHHQRCLSCSSTKESLISSSGGMADVSFDGTDGSHDITKQETSTIVSDCETSNNISNNIVPQPPSNSTKPTNIRPQPNRITSEPLSISTETTICPPRSPEPSNRSFESGYDSTNIGQGIHNSSSLSNIERKPIGAINRSRPSSATGSISISNLRLRPTDPVSQLLDIVHKIVYISYVPSNKIHHKYRRLIDRYRGYLFSKGSSQNLKSELLKLSTHSNDCIEFDIGIGRQMIGLQSLTGSSRSSSTSLLNLNAVDLTIPESDGSVTYEQMMTFIDEVLRETDYYKDTATPMSPSESLPPTVHRNQRRPSGRK
ncbi:unnamed protein product [Rotaria sp. Silwood2]|nr:unnamed protein product [Rotaria sp. Silwood2]CAF2907616.1 unnamed protein product [Rotaria sp. Silwood2]CAF3058448.1 unnamed protein product [Rotaria sp. Silwood2]CAF3910546.1 unnamed protein product [Rotaria sp. Silwood2]CAF3953241.1 unnamed protein product [Rotaria sp. Silwood2]